MLALARAAEIALVDFNFTADRACVLDTRSNDLAQPMIKQHRGVLVNTDEFGRGSRPSSGDDVFAQLVGLFFRGIIIS